MQTTTIMIRAALALLLCLACASALLQGSPPDTPIAAPTAQPTPVPEFAVCAVAVRTAGDNGARL